ncbi:hypothetical protein OTU49_014182, partial [Cherax quadricarinatus]
GCARMLSSLLLHITTFLTSIGLGESTWITFQFPGEWFGVESSVSGPTIARGSTLQASPSPQVLLLSNEIDSWMAQAEESVENMPFHLSQVLNALNGSSDDSDDDPDRIFQEAGSYCTSCHLLSNMVIGFSRLGGPIDVMANFLVKVCFIVGYKSISVCRGIINQDKDRLEFILRNTNADADEVCSLTLGSQGCGVFRRPPWNVAIPPPLLSESHTHRHSQSSNRDGYSRAVNTSPAQVQIAADSSEKSPYQSQKHGHQQQIASQPVTQSSSSSNGNGGGKRVLKVLHLTDPHFDPDYLIGSNAVCNAPLCCNSDSGPIKNPGDRAGKWGDYRNCDSPKWLLQHMLQHIVANHPDIDYVLCTGDLVPHHIWKISRQDNVAVMRQMTNILKGFFPNIPIYAAIGNHESFPRD